MGKGKHVGVFTEEEFANLKGLLRADLWEDGKKTEQEIVKFDADIDKALKEAEGSSEENKHATYAPALILLQGRNILAMSIFGDQRVCSKLDFFLEEAEEAEGEVIDPLADKHVALYDPHPPNTQAMETALFGLRTTAYSNAKELLTQILEGNVCGIIGFAPGDPESRSNVIGVLEHDLKYMDGFDYESAKAFVFPPYAELKYPYMLTEAVSIVSQMLEGTFGCVDDEVFNLEAALPSLKARMDIDPERRVSVAIADDEPQQATGMLEILNAWPGIFPSFISIYDARMTQLDDVVDAVHCVGPDVLLLDEALGVCTGSEVVEKGIGEVKIIASTTGGGRPDFTNLHFSEKGTIRKDRGSAERFVAFMNRLLAKLD